jgi:DNA-binding NtrC family response regulator
VTGFMSMTDESILVIGASRAARDAASTLTSESRDVSTVETLADLSTASLHHLMVLDTEAVSEPPWRAMEILRDTDPTAAILMLVSPGTDWASFASYRQRPTALVQQPFDREALVSAVDSALIYRKLLEENRNLKRQLGSAVSSDWVGCTEQSRGVRQSIATAAYATGSVAFIGEGGSHVCRRLRAVHGDRTSDFDRLGREVRRCDFA